MGRSLDKCKMRISRFARLNSGYFSLAITQPASPFVRHVRHEARLLVGRVATMSNTSCTLRTRKFMTNRLLARRQFVSAQSRHAAARWRVFFLSPASAEASSATAR